MTNGNLYVTGSADSPPVISSGGVSVISGKNNTVIRNIPCCAAESPWGIAFDPANGNLYVTNFYNNTVSIISGKNNTVVGSPITVGKNPYEVAFDSANRNLYVTNSGDNTITAISSQNNKKNYVTFKPKPKQSTGGLERYPYLPFNNNDFLLYHKHST